MRSQLSKAAYIFFFSFLLSACSTAPQQNTGVPERVSSAIQVESSPTSVPTPSITPTAEPSPTPTQVPLPEVINNETVSNLQVSRSFYLTTDDYPNLMKTSISPDQRLLAAWGCTEDSNNICVAPLIVLFDMDTGKVLHELEPLTTVVSAF